VFAGGSLGTSNGRVLCVDSAGHLALELPHLRHAHSHAEGADHAAHDFGEDADHADLHALIASCVDSSMMIQTMERSSFGLSANHHYLVGFNLCPPACPASGCQPSPVGRGSGAPTFRGSTAHPELAPLRSVILLV
jgi:hypothetical protein